jgi:hypothetical protein
MAATGRRFLGCPRQVSKMMSSPYTEIVTFLLLMMCGEFMIANSLSETAVLLDNKVLEFELLFMG